MYLELSLLLLLDVRKDYLLIHSRDIYGVSICGQGNHMLVRCYKEEEKIYHILTSKVGLKS